MTGGSRTTRMSAVMDYDVMTEEQIDDYINGHELKIKELKKQQNQWDPKRKSEVDKRKHKMEVLEPMK